jgi:hypothetical protein
MELEALAIFFGFGMELNMINNLLYLFDRAKVQVGLGRGLFGIALGRMDLKWLAKSLLADMLTKLVSTLCFLGECGSECGKFTTA